jgi:hypothetical protein
VSPRVLGACAIAVIVALTGSVRLGSARATTGSASLSLSIRAEFLKTSLAMMATAPLTGVGIGTYYERSSQFMTPVLRKSTTRERAQLLPADLGGTGTRRLCSRFFGGWGARSASDGCTCAVKAGAVRRSPRCADAVCFLLTCVTGHRFWSSRRRAVLGRPRPPTAALAPNRFRRGPSAPNGRRREDSARTRCCAAAAKNPPNAACILTAMPRSRPGHDCAGMVGSWPAHRRCA